MAATGTLTGASTLLAVSWLEQREGPSTVETLFDKLRSERGHQVQRHDISKTGQVDFHLHTSILEEIASLTDADAETLREIGRDGARNVNQVVPGAKLMLKMANPKRLLKHAPKLWGTYADFGEVKVHRDGKGQGRLEISGFESHPHFCRTLEGFFEELFTMVGAKNVEIREADHTPGPERCVFVGSWS